MPDSSDVHSHDGSGTQGKKSGLTKLKERNAALEQEQARSDAAIAELRAQNQQLAAKLDAFMQGHAQGQPQEQKIDRNYLEGVAFTDDPEVSGSKARIAMNELFKDELARMREEIVQEVTSSVDTRFQGQNDLLQTEREIVQLFGQESMDPNSPQFKMASDIIAARGNPNPTGADYKMAFMEAGLRLSQQADLTTEDTPPPDGVQATGSSNTAVDYKAQRDLAAEKGDTKGQLKAIAGNLGFE